MAIDAEEWNSFFSDLTAEFFKATLMHCGALHWKGIPKIGTGDKNRSCNLMVQIESNV